MSIIINSIALCYLASHKNYFHWQLLKFSLSYS
jgi:hypothetical protein